MASIDRRVVEMKFDNAAFQRGVENTLSTLDKLKQKLNFGGAAKGLNEVASAGSKMNFSGIGGGVDALTAKFSALQVAGVAAFGTIVAKATAAAGNLVKSFTLAPITQGFSEYELKMKSIQTIMANTRRHGTGLETVNAELEKLNQYADKTIYSFSEMTKNASLFTNSGMKIEDATTVIKGWSNEAAASGASAEDAARGAYQMTQAISAGTIKAIDWISVTNAGMGNKNMTDGLVKMAEGMGKFEGKAGLAESATKNFKGSLEKGWLTADVMSAYLKAMSGDMTDAELAALGLDAATVKLIQGQAKAGLEAATMVRTFSGMMGALKESVASGWTTSFEYIFGNFTEATELFTGMSNAISGVIVGSANARNKMLSDWKDAGGRTAVIEGLKNIFQALGAVARAVGAAFREIFPRQTGENLAEISKRFQAFTENLKVGGDTFQRIKSTFEGVFSILGIGVEIIKQVVRAIAGIVGTVAPASGGLIAFTAVAGEAIRKIRDFIEATGIIEKFFTVLLSPLLLIRPLIGLLVDLSIAVNRLLMGDIGGFADKFKLAFSNLGGALGDVVSKMFGFSTSFRDAITNIADIFANMATRAKESGNGFLAAIAGAISKVLTVLNTFGFSARTALLKFATEVSSAMKSGMTFIEAFRQGVQTRVAALAAFLQNASNNGRSFMSDFGTAALTRIQGVINSLIGTFQRFRSEMGFKTEFDGVATSAGVASGALGVLSGIGSVIASVFRGLAGVFTGLFNAIGPFTTQVAAFFTELVAKFREWLAGMDMNDAVSVINTGFFIALYIALRRFVSNIRQVAGQFGDMAQNIGDTFGQLTDTLKSMQNSVRANIILKIAIAVGILVAAVVVLSKIDAAALKQALIGLGIMFAQLALTLTIISKFALTDASGVISAGIMLVALAVAVRILAGAVREMSELSYEEMKQGLIGVGAILAGLALFTRLASADAGGVKVGAGLVLLAVAIKMLSQSVAELGAMDTGQLIKGIVALGVMVGLLAGIVYVMNGVKGIPAAAAGLLILSAALMALLIPLKAYSMMDWGTMIKGLSLIALTLTAVGLALRSFPSNMMALSAGLVLVAGALVAISGVIGILGNMDMGTLVKGLLAMGLALTAMVIALNAAAGGLPGAAAILVTAGALAVLAPVMVILSKISWEGIAKGIVAIAAVLAVITVAMYALAPVIAVMVLFSAGIKALGIAMLLAGAGFALFAGGVAALAVTGAAGFAVIMAAIVSFLNLLPLMAQQVGHAFVTFALVLAQSGPKILQALGTVLLAFLEQIRRVIPSLVQTVGAFIMAMVDEITRRVPQIAAKGLEMIVGLLKAIRSRIGEITNIVIDIFVIFINTLRGRLPTIVQSGLNFILSFIEGLAAAIRGNRERVGNAGADLATALVEGAINGLRSLAGNLASRAREIFNQMVTAVRQFLGIQSPSTVFMTMGVQVIQGMINGITSMVGGLLGRAGSAMSSAVTSARNALSTAGSVGTQMIGNIVGGIGGAVGGLLSRAGSAISSALTSARNALSSAASVGSDMVKRIGSGIASVAGSIGTALSGAVRGAVSAARGAIGNASEIGSSIVSGIARGISNGLSIVTNAARNLAKSALDGAKSLLGINSPSKEFEKVGEFVNDGFAKGLTGGSQEQVTSAMEKMAELLKATIENATSDIEKSTQKIEELTKAQVDNTEQRKLDQKALDDDIAKLKVLTNEQKANEAAIKSTGAEITRDKQRIKELTAERNKDTAAVKAAQAELDRDKAQLLQLTSARNQDKAAIAAKRAEIQKDTVALRELTAERNKDTAALKAAQSELAKDETRLRTLTQGRQADTDAIAAKTLEIEKQQEKLRQLTEKENENAAAITATKDAIAQATAERDRAAIASDILANKMQTEVAELRNLTTTHQGLSTQLDAANKSLEDAIKKRDDYQKSVEDKYKALPDINKEMTLSEYLETLQKKVDDTNQFSEAVQKLRDMGLNDETYRELVEKGVDALPFVNELLAGGKRSVDEVNRIGSNLISASQKMGSQASQALYQAGVQTGQGLVAGLNSQLAAVQAAMAALAAAMQAKINAELKIKSPSRVFMKIGDYTVQGLVRGLQDAKNSAANAAGGLGDGITSALQQSLSDLSTVLDGQMDLDPVIRPIMDLSDIEKKANLIGSMIKPPSVSIDGAYSSAVSASAGYRSNRAAAMEESGSVATAPAPAPITFVQNNTSPKALSQAELYRQTNNQLSRARGALYTG